VVAATRERFSGKRRNPFDEAECGHHYARALASWGLIPALTGFGYDGRTGTLEFAPATERTRWFWSSGAAWGTLEQQPAGNGQQLLTLDVLDGSLRVDRVLVGEAMFRPDVPGLLAAGNHRLRQET